MRKLLYLLSFFFIGQSLAQDTVYSLSSEISITDLSQRDFIFFAGCSHGHICCQVGCLCCTELQRPQYYDTIYHPVQNGVQRITIVERYFYASTHERSPVHYRFKNAEGQLSEKWFLAEQSYFNFYDVNGFDRYPKELEERYQKNNAVLVMDEMGAFHRIDLQGNPLTMIFHSRKKVDQNVYLSMFIANEQRFYGFTDSTGAQLGRLNYVRVLPFNENGIAIVADAQGLHGLVNCEGKEILPLAYHQLTEIGIDRFSVSQNGKQAIMKSNGEMVGEGGFVRIEHYSEGKVFVQKDQRTKSDNNVIWMCLDMDGNELFALKAEWVSEFHDGMAGVFKNNKWGFIDTTGKLMIDYQYDRIRPFEKGVAPVCVTNSDRQDEWFLIDRKGDPINKKHYGELSNYKNGIARATVRGQGVGLIDTKGKEILPCVYLFAGYGTKTDWFIEGTMLVTALGKEHSYALLDRDGNMLLDLSKYRAANYVIVTNDPFPRLPLLIVSKDNNMCTLIDFKGKEILSREYKSITLLNDQLAVGIIGSNYYLIDLNTDQHLLEFSDSHYYSFRDDLFMIDTKDYPRTYQYYDVHGNKVSVYGDNE